ncbi:hypothetical protein D9611_006948 [Ephemerocybe angulata]|uniref:Uncharacterized protein n=1 Tax=Ephemerocybe angulata TaxID=980116 RepID=A0A8H5EVI7_9AGAR|nr:hypothetical protein D9611_006948 [Tulosesus angulatus]
MATAMNQAMANASVESPLSTLVRRASSRRKPPPSLDTSGQRLVQTPAITFQYDYAEDTPQFQDNSSDTFKPPHSPLLHGHFARDSVATASDYEGNSYLESASPNSTRTHSFSSSNAYADSELDYRYHYDNAYEESVYSQPDMTNTNSRGAALRDSWNSTATTSTVRPGTRLEGGQDGQYISTNQVWGDGEQQQHQYTSREEDNGYYNDYNDYFGSAATGDVRATSPAVQQHTAGRTPIVKPVSANFSRPVRPAVEVDQALEERKRQVLLRNLSRQGSKSPTPGSSLRNAVSGDGQPSRATSPSSPYTNTGSASSSTHLSPYSPQPVLSKQRSNLSQKSSLAPTEPLPQPPTISRQASNLSQQSSTSSTQSHAPSISRQGSNISQESTPSPQQPAMSRQPYNAPQQSLLSPHPQPPPMSRQNESQPPSSHLSPRPQLNTTPSERTQSTTSVYSNYSYYQYESAVPSPTGSTFSNANDPFSVKRGSAAGASKMNQSRTPSPLPTTDKEKAKGPKTAHDYLLLGIEHHEADRLNESARCFERSTVEGGGCGVGMLMWGLTLRHGWGCPKNEKLAFKWLQKAAESAVEDLEATRARGIKDNSVLQSELILAIYEVGQCFFQGWGVPKDQKMAVSYYTIAAELGDPDAQMDLAFCLTNGKGCKKDKKAAAKWYRAAIKQGQSDVGLAWVYKDKYQ